MRRFYLYKRGSIYYCQLRNPLTKKILPAKSTGKKDYDEAELVAMGWLVNGIPGNRTTDPRKTDSIYSFETAMEYLKAADLTKENAERVIRLFQKRGIIKSATIKDDGPEFIQWLYDFWDYEKSPYIAERKAYGHSIGLRRCKDAKSSIKLHWAPFFKDTLRTEVTKEDIRAFSRHLGTLNLAPRSINKIISAGQVALRWAADNDLIKTDPTQGLRKYSGTGKKRGILSEQEIEKLFAPENWRKNETARLANMLAMVTGCRAGEIMGLRIQDIGEDRLYIRHSYSYVDGLKSPKNGEEREVPILPELREQILSIAKRNPLMPSPSNFVFWSLVEPEKPMRGETFTTRLVKALKKIGISNDERLARGICFHSWRHYYAASMARKLDIRTARLTGHKDQATFEEYANHAAAVDFDKAAAATAEVFGRVLTFKKTG